MIGYFFAALSGMILGLMNVTDKFVVSHRVKRPFGYAVFVGLFNLLIGIIVATFLDWTNVTLLALVMPVFAGIMYGSGCYAYYAIMGKEDASHAIGLTFLYPLLIAIFSFMFLGERLLPLQYLGVILTIVGTVLLSVRINEIKLRTSIWAISFIIVSTALLDLAVKFASDEISVWNGSSVTFITFGVTVLLGLFFKRVREDARHEWKNAKWTCITESLNYLGNVSLYAAMALLPATIVSSICATQPLFVLFFEKLAHMRFGSMARDEKFGGKLIAILCIVAGIALLSAFGY